MATLTQLEDRLSLGISEALAIIQQLSHVRQRLENIKTQQRQQYQQNTLLLEVLIQAEDIVRTISYRYHNCHLNSDAE